MPGGNTTSRTRPHRMVKGTGHTAPDVKALSGAETFADPRNLQLFDKGAGDSYDIDTDYGLANWSGEIHDNPEDTQGNKGWKASDPPAYKKDNWTQGAKGKGSDPTPGGGWGTPDE